MSWVAGLPAEARKIVARIAPRSDGGRYPDGRDSSGWWLRVSPSTGPARNAVLVRKNESRRVVWQAEILRDGQLVFDEEMVWHE